MGIIIELKLLNNIFCVVMFINEEKRSTLKICLAIANSNRYVILGYHILNAIILAHTLYFTVQINMILLTSYRGGNKVIGHTR